MEECRRLQGMACQISMAFLLYFVGLTIYAARRRTELRERFNIAGAELVGVHKPRSHACLLIAAGPQYSKVRLN